MDIKRKILSDPVNTWVFNQSNKDTYLVGGYLRDLLRGAKPEDKDFVLRKGAETLARKAAKSFGGKVIDLHNKQTFRVALKSRRFIDFSPMKNNIMEDLRSRDFSINAVAWSPASGILDPDNYLNDIKSRVVRHISPQNLLDDPLRILRAYRLSAQLNFAIVIDTRRFLKKYSKKIESAAPERITEEVFKLLNTKNAFNYIQLCSEDNVISRLINLTSYNIKINIHSIKAFDTFLEKSLTTNTRKIMNNYLWSELGQGLKRYGFIRLYLLLRKYDKKAKRIYDTGPGSEILHKNSMLRVSTRIKKSIHALEKAESLCSGRMTDKRLYQAFRNAGDCIYEIAIIQSIMKPRSHSRIFSRADSFLYKRNNTLINGRDIKAILGIDSGRVIGEIKERVFENQFREKIRSRRDAKEFIARYFT